MIRCKSCGAAHPLNTLFCDECGVRMSDTPATSATVLAEELEPPAAGGPASLPERPAPERRNAAQQLVVRLATRDDSTRYECPLLTELLIGRSDHGGNRPDIDLTNLQAIERGVSRRHARIVRAGDDAALEDLNSLNGTFVGGHRLTPGHPEVIRPGDELQFGKVILVFSR
jgi:hypothetical protein